MCVLAVRSVVHVTEENLSNYEPTDVVLPLPDRSVELPKNEGEEKTELVMVRS